MIGRCCITVVIILNQNMLYIWIREDNKSMKHATKTGETAGYILSQESEVLTLRIIVGSLAGMLLISIIAITLMALIPLYKDRK